jgi:hypothetical protein
MDSYKGAVVSVWNCKKTLELVATRKVVKQKCALISYFPTFELIQFWICQARINIKYIYSPEKFSCNVIQVHADEIILIENSNKRI